MNEFEQATAIANRFLDDGDSFGRRDPDGDECVLARQFNRLRESLSWRPIEIAPKDGRWIIAISNDRTTLYRVSWGRDRRGELWWCSTERSYGDGVFGGWLPCPDFA